MTTDAPALLAVRRGRIHPALYADERGIVLGRVTDDGASVQCVTSAPHAILEPADLKDQFLFQPRPYLDLAGRWPGDDVLDFIRTGDAPTFSETLAITMHALDEAMEFPRTEQRALIAVWSLATYFHPLFLSFPRLNLSGERESGKSKLLTLLRATAWNALLMLTPTPAVLYRLVHEFRPTLLLDEVEGLSKEDARDVLAIINSGYKAGGSVPRCEGEKTKRVELYQCYAPLALAAIRTLNATTEDRCLPLVLQRGTDRNRVNREVDPTAPVYTRIRAACHRLALVRWRQVALAYHTAALPAWLNARARELWRPLLAVAAAADHEDGAKVSPDLIALAREHVEDREGVSAEAEALLAALSSQLDGAAERLIRPRDLREPIQDRLGWREPPTPEAVGAWLRRLGFRRAGKDREGARYHVTAARLQDVQARYAIDGPNGDGVPPPPATVTPPPSRPNLASFQDG